MLKIKRFIVNNIAQAFFLVLMAVTMIKTTVAASLDLENVVPDEVYLELNRSINKKDIYKIELLVFADDYREYDGEEQWPKAQALNYPEKLLQLYESSSISTQVNTLLEQIQQYSLNDYTDTHPEKNPRSALKVEAETTNNDITENALPLLMLSSTSSANSQVATLAKTLKRRSRYRTLFHQEWFQALAPKSSAPAVVIRGGRNTLDRYELEGSVTLSKGRYLHITTDLWLIDWVANSVVDKPWYLEETLNWQVPTLDRDTPHPLISLLESKLDDITLPPSTEKGLAIQTTADEFDEWEEVDTLDALQHLEASMQKSQRLEPNAKQVYYLREYRRMKRDEVHYIDHPLFGIVVAISKWQPDNKMGN